MADAAQRQDWIRRVLGVDLRAGAQTTGSPAALANGPAIGATAAVEPPPSLEPGAKLLPFWMAAKEKVDAELAKLQGALAGFDDPDLAQVAEYGLNGITTRQTVLLMAALREADTADTPAGRAKATKAVQAFSDFLDGEPMVDLLEDTPFGVSVPLRAVFGPALGQLKQRLAA